MKLTKLLFFVLFLIVQLKALGQIGGMSLSEYQSIKNEKSKYFDSLIVDSQNLKGLGYKDFKRQVVFYDQAFQNENGPLNYFKAKGKALTQLRNKYLSETKTSSKTSNVQGNWTEVGPVNMAQGPGVRRMRGTGRLYFIEFDDLNNRVFTGSVLGGLWYSEDAGQSWVSGGTDYLPQPGISHMQVAQNTNNGNTWFIVTGDGETSFDPSDGVWRTTNKGQTWEHMDPVDNWLGIAGVPFWSRCRKLLAHPVSSPKISTV